MKTEQITVHRWKNAASGDIEKLQQLCILSFRESFQVQNDPDNFEDYLQKSFNIETLRQQLNHPSSVFYTLSAGDQLAAYLKVNKDDAQKESKRASHVEIERIYVLREFHGNGLGAFMITLAMNYALENGRNHLWLGVWEKNPEAIAFYERMGFKTTGKHLFQLGEEAQTDYIMEKSLAPWTIYMHDTVRALSARYGIFTTAHHVPLKNRLKNFADILEHGLVSGDDDALAEVSNYHPQMLGAKKDRILDSRNLDEIAAETIIAEFGFESWDQVNSSRPSPGQIAFEYAVDMLLTGNLSALKSLLRRNPSLSRQRSVFGHKASLLHYCGSNGVELFRQRVPLNLPDIIELLITHGADPSAQMKVYGGLYTALELLETSTHPVVAGIRDRAIKTIRRFNR